MSLPKTMRALKNTGAGTAEIQDVPLPRLRDDYVLIKVSSVALNPTDWKHIDFLSSAGATVGCDMAGTIVSVGSKVTKKFSEGDKVAAFTHGVNAVEHEDGAFGEYAVAKGDLVIPLPKGLSVQEGATLGVGVSTVGQGLYQSLELPLPGEGQKDGKWLLVYGGSTATGSLAVQYAQLSGYKVVTTNSPHNNSLLEKLGVDKCFDYSDENCGKKIREYTGDSLVKAFDCISAGNSAKICGDAISSKGGKISFLLPVEQDKTGRKDVEVARTLAYSITGESFKFGPADIPAAPADFTFGKKFWDLSYNLLSEGKVSVHPPEVRGGGLDKVQEGLQDLQQNKVSGKKLVYNFA